MNLNRFFIAIGFSLAVIVGCFVFNNVSHAEKVGHDMLAVGTKAPDFSLEASTKKHVSLQDYHGKTLLLIFYPLDSSPGCTIQLCSLRDHYKSYQALNAEGIAINPGSIESHEKFALNNNYQFPILSDPDKTVAKAYGVLGPFGFLQRTVYIIDGNGVIRYAQRGMTNQSDILNMLTGLKK